MGSDPFFETNDDKEIALLREKVLVGEEVFKSLAGIIEIGKRDTTNPKYDGYYLRAKKALAAYRSIPSTGKE